MASENDALLERLHGAGYLKAEKRRKKEAPEAVATLAPAAVASQAALAAVMAAVVQAPEPDTEDVACASSPAVVAPSPKPAPLSSSAFFSPEVPHQPRQAISQNLQRTLGEHPRQRNRPGSGHAWSYADASPLLTSSGDAPRAQPPVLLEARKRFMQRHSTAGASSTSPDSVNVQLHDFGSTGTKYPAARAARAEIAAVGGVQRAPLLHESLALFILDLVLLLVAVSIAAAASIVGWRPPHARTVELPATTMTLATTTTTTANERSMEQPYLSPGHLISPGGRAGGSATPRSAWFARIVGR